MLKGSLHKTVMTVFMMSALFHGVNTAMAQDNTQEKNAESSANTKNTAPATDKPNWIKFCGEDQTVKKKVCTVISKDLKAKQGQFLASAQIIEIPGKQKILRAIIPLRFQLPAGVKIQIDNGKSLAGRFVICFGNGCFAEVGVDSNFISSMKRGNDMTVTALNMQGRPVPFKFTLSGFTSSYDGDPIDPKAFQDKNQAQQEQLQSELKKRAEEARKKLEKSQ